MRERQFCPSYRSYLNILYIVGFVLHKTRKSRLELLHIWVQWLAFNMNESSFLSREELEAVYRLLISTFLLESSQRSIHFWIPIKWKQCIFKISFFQLNLLNWNSWHFAQSMRLKCGSESGLCYADRNISETFSSVDPWNKLKLLEIQQLSLQFLLAFNFVLFNFIQVASSPVLQN